MVHITEEEITDYIAVSQHFTASILFGVAQCVIATEVPVPERYLRPRTYNPHPLETLLGATPGRLQQVLLDQNPYQYLSRPPSRQEDSSPVQFPAVPEAVKPTKSYTPGYITVPKNYAFAYAVKDRYSGDDFSHKQAHNGQSTKGEYRVKLPDGRTQIVSYTADNSGYKADVRYDGEPAPARAAPAAPLAPSAPSAPGNLYYSPTHYGSLSNSILQEPDYQDLSEVVYRQPVRVLHKTNRVAQQYAKLSYNPTPTPETLQVLFSPTPRPYKTLTQPLQYRALPQTAEEYTSSDTPNYYPSYDSSTAQPGYYSPVSSTAATPIVEDQDDVPAPAKPAKPAARSQYSVFTASSPAPPVRYIYVPQPTQYVYSDSDS